MYSTTIREKGARFAADISFKRVKVNALLQDARAKRDAEKSEDENAGESSVAQQLIESIQTHLEQLGAKLQSVAQSFNTPESKQKLLDTIEQEKTMLDCYKKGGVKSCFETLQILMKEVREFVMKETPTPLDIEPK